MAQRLMIGAAATLIALVGMSACGGLDGAEPLPETSESSAAPTQTPTDDEEPTKTSDPSPTPTDDNGGDDGDEGFVYLPWGPDDAPIPQQYEFLAASGSQPPSCDDLAGAKPEGAFWETTLAVCRAIVEGADWPATTTVPAPPPAANAYEACLDAELTEMLERALRWHADNPGRQPEMDYPSHASTSPCQAHIYEVRVLGEADLDPGESRMPDGIPLAITGSAMDRNPLSVTVDGELAEFTGDFHVDRPDGKGLAIVVVLAPSAEQPRTATIVVSTFRGPIEATVDLPGSAPTTPPPTDVVTPTPTDPPTTESPAPSE